jgi:hypothetical protein
MMMAAPQKANACDFFLEDSIGGHMRIILVAMTS